MCWIFPKLDGTNASVWYEEERIRAGSRTRVLTIEQDNAGFFAWVNSRREQFFKLFQQMPHWTLYGEWLVPHSLKTYRQDAWRRFWIFDVYDRGQQRYVPYEEYRWVLEEHGLDYVPPLGVFESPGKADLERMVNQNTFLIGDGAGLGEGIVLKNYAFRSVFGRQTWAKIVRNEFKDENRKVFGGNRVQNGTAEVERIIAEKYTTAHLVQKTLAKIREEMKDAEWDELNSNRLLDRQLIPRLLETVWYEIIKEELWSALKEHRNPVIDFKCLRKFVTYYAKHHVPELFGG